MHNYLSVQQLNDIYTYIKMQKKLYNTYFHVKENLLKIKGNCVVGRQPTKQTRSL